MASARYYDVDFEAPAVKLMAILEGIKLVLKLKCDKIVVESDCEVAINFILRKSIVWTNVKVLMEEI